MGQKQIRTATKSEIKWFRESEIYKHTGMVDPAKMHALLEPDDEFYFGR